MATEESKVGEREQVSAGGLVDDSMRGAVTFDGIGPIRMAHCVEEKCTLPMIEIVVGLEHHASIGDLTLLLCKV